MARLNPSMPRKVAIERTYIGNAIIFCEGTTEYNYFNHFIEIFNINESKYTDINLEFEMQNVGGDAETVYRYAENFLKDEKNSKKYKDFDKYLVFDCDNPPSIGKTLEAMKSSENEYKLLLTNSLFEVWLLMHFEKVTMPMGNDPIYKKMAQYLKKTKYGQREKASKGCIRCIIGDGTNVKNAIANAEEIKEQHGNKIEAVSKNIETLNPYTEVHTFVKDMMYEIEKLNDKK